MSDPQNLIDDLLRAGREIAERGFVIGSGGNLSARTEEAVYVKASGVHLLNADAADYVQVALGTGNPAGDSRAPSVELPMHLACYRGDANISAVIHCHPAMAIAWAATGEDLGSLTPDSAAYLGERVPVLPYFPPSSTELADLIERNIRAGAAAVILANHGVCVTGRDLDEAIRRTCLVEETAKVASFSRLLNPKCEFFTPDQVEAVRKRAYRLLAGDS